MLILGYVGIPCASKCTTMIYFQLFSIPSFELCHSLRTVISQVCSSYKRFCPTVFGINFVSVSIERTVSMSVQFICSSVLGIVSSCRFPSDYKFSPPLSKNRAFNFLSDDCSAIVFYLRNFSNNRLLCFTYTHMYWNLSSMNVTKDSAPFSDLALIFPHTSL